MMKLFRQEFDLGLLYKEGVVLDHFPIHHFNERLKIRLFWKQYFWSSLFSPLTPSVNLKSFRPLTQIAFYHGIQVGYFFSFLITYTAWIFPLSLVHLTLQTVEWSVWGNLNTPLTKFVPLINGIWSSIFYINWRRREGDLSHIFGTQIISGYDEDHEDRGLRPAYQGDYVVDHVTQEIVRKDWVGAGKRRILVRLP